jgi:phage host-nuclease inhibitor protein Gam
MTRIKPVDTAPVPQYLEDADAALARLCALRRRIALIETSMNDEIDAIKLKSAREAEPYRTETAGLERALARYAEYNKAELFARRKSVELTFGTFGFRRSAEIRPLAKWTWARVLRNIKDWGRMDLVRTREEPDKEVMKRLSPEELKELGCRVVQEDVFYYEPAEQDLSAGEAA